jgi:hypothetical protein
MTFILVPERGEDVQINAWNWRPTLELLLAAGLISEEQHERMGAQGAGGSVDAEQAGRIAEVIAAKLSDMKSGERLLADLTITSEPKTKWYITPETKPGDIAVNDAYSASYEWLSKFAEFCKRSGGFEVY